MIGSETINRPGRSCKQSPAAEGSADIEELQLVGKTVLYIFLVFPVIQPYISSFLSPVYALANTPFKFKHSNNIDFNIP